MPAPYRADHVGSLLRPAELIQARTEYTAGTLPLERLRELEDAATLRALDMQKRAGVDIYSSGEYRRSGWASAALMSLSWVKLTICTLGRGTKPNDGSKPSPSHL